MKNSTPNAPGSIWFLAGQTDDSDHKRYIPIHSNPFVVGRRSDCELCLPVKTVSSNHAQLVAHETTLVLGDLNSTNGTFVNGKRVKGQIELHQDDFVQFADIAFRVCQQSTDGDMHTVQEDVCDRALALVQFDKMMSERALTPYFQPIVDMNDQHPIGYEVLARSRFFGLETPNAMFQAAAQLNMEIELSNMFRWESLQVSKAFPAPPHLFLNTHPLEVSGDQLLPSLRALREIYPEQELTLEIHEAAVTDLQAMAELRAGLQAINIHLAFDDFGAGQTRLVELVDIRPDYLKFDIKLVRGIHDASPGRQQLLGHLVNMVRELDIVPLAEGIESPADGEACLELGFELGQGFLYGKPAPSTLYTASTSDVAESWTLDGHPAEVFRSR